MAFNAKQNSLDNDRVHDNGPGYVKVTAESHPALFYVFEAISHDNGGSAGHDSYSVPTRFQDDLPVVEEILGNLTDDQRDTVACGDQDDGAAILGDLEPEKVEVVDRLLNGFFDDWEEP